MDNRKELTRKKVVKVGKYTVTVRSNEPSAEAIRESNKWINKKAWKYVLKTEQPTEHP